MKTPSLALNRFLRALFLFSSTSLSSPESKLNLNVYLNLHSIRAFIFLFTHFESKLSKVNMRYTSISDEHSSSQAANLTLCAVKLHLLQLLLSRTIKNRVGQVSFLVY